ncbi:MAG: hypothetical protein CMJ32_11320 [Phycisphaerae bacterium]|nr:hypothetical protein [Phycisphaerae bacterium]
MHILIINFHLKELGREQYEAVCNEVAENFAGIPGLISKHWLANEDTNTYGGVYVWKDHQSLLDYKNSEIFISILENPAFDNVQALDFEVLAEPSSVTGVG